MAVEGFQGTQPAVDGGSILLAGDSNIQPGGSFRGYHIHARAPFDQSHIQGEAALQIHQPGNPGNLSGHFEDGALTPFEIEARVRGFSRDLQGVGANPLAGGFHRSLPSEGRLKYQYAGGLLRQTFGDGARGGAAHFFVRNQQHGDGAGQFTR